MELLEGIFEHGGNDSAKKWTSQFQARISVDFNQPDFEVLVDHVIKAEYLKAELLLGGVYLGVNRPENV